MSSFQQTLMVQLSENKDTDIERAKLYEKIWVDVWIATAGSNSCININTPAKYADRCLADFKAKFN